MQTRLVKSFGETDLGKEAEKILRSCVHCGFCNATCPTYQILGDELDGPRGRIYLIKQALEGSAVSHRTQNHLDRCLTCRSCETTCPSGVRYARLLDIGRAVISGQVDRSPIDRLARKILRLTIPFASRVRVLAGFGRAIKPFLPPALKQKIPAATSGQSWPKARHSRRMLVLNSCVQSALAPQIDAAAARILDRIGISLVRSHQGGCCGAVSQHLGHPEEALNFVRRNIDAWWPLIDAGIEKIVSTASGCGLMVKEYGELLQHDPEYADKARQISLITRDIAEILSKEDLSALQAASPKRIAFQTPCTLQHGQKVQGIVEKILVSAGYQLTAVENPHLCCGSAGTYSILQQTLSKRLLTDKIEALEKHSPDVIATGNIGCLLHLRTAAKNPVQHWVELLAAD